MLTDTAAWGYPQGTPAPAAKGAKFGPPRRLVAKPPVATLPEYLGRSLGAIFYLIRRASQRSVIDTSSLRVSPNA